jgi:hypothetical protein
MAPPTCISELHEEVKDVATKLVDDMVFPDDDDDDDGAPAIGALTM